MFDLPTVRPTRVAPERQSTLGRRVKCGAIAGVVVVILSAVAWFGARFDPLGTAHAAYKRGEYRTSLRAAKARLAFFHRDQAASLMAARCLTRLGHAAEAEAFYDRSEPLEIDDLRARAEGLVRADLTRPAAEVFEEILKRRPDDAGPLKKLAFIRLGLKQWTSALELTGRLIAIPSEAVFGLTMAGIAHHESKNYNQSVAASVRVLELDPDLKRMPLPKALFWQNLAKDLIATGRSDEARAYLECALVDRKDAGLMELLGLTYFHQGATDRAEECWRQAAGLDPENMMVSLYLGWIALRREQWGEAVRLLKPAADRSTTAVVPLYNLSQAYRMLGRLDEAAHYNRLADQRRVRWKASETDAGADVESFGPREVMGTQSNQGR